MSSAGKQCKPWKKSRSITKQNDDNKNTITSTNSLSYSSSDSSKDDSTGTNTSTLTILRPSSTIKAHSDIKPPQNKKKQLKKEWKNFFRNSAQQPKNVEVIRKIPQIQTKMFNPKPFQNSNLPFGDDINFSSDVDGFLFHNINGMKDDSNWTQINIVMSDLNITCFGLVEINTTLRGSAFHKWNDITRRTFKHSKCCFSESDITLENNYKPGGTLTTIVGKWQARISEKGSDPSGLGRWNYMKLSSNKQNLVVITAYRPCKTTGPMTNWTQQWLLL
jgi:hypothetical protein